MPAQKRKSNPKAKARAIRNIGGILSNRPEGVKQVSTESLQAVKGTSTASQVANMAIDRELQGRSTSTDYAKASKSKTRKYR